MRRHLVSRVLPGFAIIGRAQFRSKRLRALPASYALTGSDVDLRLGTLLILEAGTGAFALTGQDASLLVGRRVAAEAASFALTGQDVTLQKRKSLTAEVASFALTGEDSGLKVARRVVAEAASFALAGTAATMRKGLNLVADAASFALAGQGAGVRVARKIAAAAASFALTGQAAILRMSRKLAAAAASFALTGQDATLTKAGAIARSTTASATNTTVSTTHNMGTLSIGTAAADRDVIVTGFTRFNNGISGTMSGVTIGGVSATIDIQNASGGHHAWIARLRVTSGTTAEIIVTASTAMSHTGIQVYEMTGASTDAPVTDTTTSTSTPVTLTQTVPAGGAVFGCQGEDSSNVTGLAFTAGLTEDLEQSLASNFARAAHGSLVTATQLTSQSFTATRSGTRGSASDRFSIAIYSPA